jgi:hypothetical protein
MSSFRLIAVLFFALPFAASLFAPAAQATLVPRTVMAEEFGFST